ncbi:MAG: U32 family peptidase, partial [Muribaculaceae bacterium]|nr:U32 family peptidase [Muribaculaceae bacterium]
MSSQTPRYSIELLAPARNAEIGICAINHGADAVYIGASSHGARAAAGNSVEDIARLCNYAHQFGARVYVTVNTLIYPSELKEVEKLIGRLYRVGVDALIVQDPGILRLDIPPIALHASTQCDIRTPEKARFFQDLGFSQIVLPREMTLEEIRAVRAATSVPLEGFVHGALCVSYSGQCYASLHCGGRSANRGECAQICRLPYDLIDGRGRVLAKGKHLLSLHDLNRLDDLPA